MILNNFEKHTIEIRRYRDIARLTNPWSYNIEMQQKLVEGQGNISSLFFLIKLCPQTDNDFHVRLATFIALNNLHMGKMKTKSLYTEIVYHLSEDTSISRTTAEFSLFAGQALEDCETREAVVIAIDVPCIDTLADKFIQFSNGKAQGNWEPVSLQAKDAIPRRIRNAIAIKTL